MGFIGVGTIGLRVNVSVGVDLGSPASIQVRFEKPDGSASTKDVTTYDADAGKVYFVTAAGDLDTAGTYKFRSIYKPDAAGTSIFYGELATFVVGAL